MRLKPLWAYYIYVSRNNSINANVCFTNTTDTFVQTQLRRNSSIVYPSAAQNHRFHKTMLLVPAKQWNTKTINFWSLRKCRSSAHINYFSECCKKTTTHFEMYALTHTRHAFLYFLHVWYCNASSGIRIIMIFHTTRPF